MLTRRSDLIYPRNVPENARTAVPKPPEFQIDDFEELSLRTPDEENLHAFLLRPTTIRDRQNVTIIMFHGNAGNIGHRLPIAKVLTADLGYNVFFVEYRGYGFSTGDPNEKGLNIDAQTALDYVRGRDDLRSSKIVIYGQSLGGAVAINLVNRNQKEGDIAALILENTFLSIRSLIPRFVSRFYDYSNSISILPPAKYLAMLCHQIWPSNEVLPRIRDVPVLFLSGLRDEIVPYVARKGHAALTLARAAHMKALHELCQSDNKVWQEFGEGTHNDTVAQAGYFESVSDFILNYVLKLEKPQRRVTDDS